MAKVDDLALDRGYSGLIGLQQTVFQGVQVSLYVGNQSPQFMGHVSHQITPLQFGVLQIGGHWKSTP